MDPVNLLDYEVLARDRMEPGAFDYVAGGAGDEVTLRENRAAFERIRLRPRVLVDVSVVDPAAVILGTRVPTPVLLAPTAFQTLAHADGELATARAATAAGVIMVASTMSSFRLEEIAAAATGPKWFQLYCYREREITRQLVARAEAAGYRAICLTVDLARVGPRERDVRNAFQLPAHALPRNFEGLVDHIYDQGATSLKFNQYIMSLVDPALTWADVGWLKSITSLPVVLKGILTAEDARLAADHGADAVIVSNHGARQLDGAPATIEVLEEVVDAGGGRLEVLLDGGVRRGTDVVKALAMGAKAVLVGRGYVWGLAADGQAGVENVLRLLRDEIELAMALLGCPTASDIEPGHVRWAGV